MPKRIALTDLAAALAEQNVRATYRACYELILNGQMPTATRSPTGRWTVSNEALPEIAAAYAERHPAAVAA